MVSKVQNSSYKSLPDSEQITDPKKVSRLLKRFTKHYTPLTIQIPGHEEHYTSCIVGVDDEYVLLDELLPNTGHQSLVTEGALQVTGNIDGIDIQFFTALKRVSEKNNVLTYYIKLPKLLDYRQRRQSFRVRIPMSIKLAVTIKNSDGEVFKGELYDLSHGGAGMIFQADKTIIETGGVYECGIGLIDGEWIDCTAELRYSKAIRSGARKFFGIQFVGLLPVQSRLVGRCINELQRELISKRAAY